MANAIEIWRFDALGTGAAEQINMQPIPNSLDEATGRLPGGAYTTFRTFHHNRVLRLADHFARLEETARLAGKPVRPDRARTIAALHQALAVYPSSETRVRIILDLEEQVGTMYILVEGLHTPDAQDYQNGVRVVTRHLQRVNPKAKLTTFIETAAHVREELPPGLNEAVMVGEDGRLLEGLSSNFFAVRDGVIWTAEQGVLSGITRSLVLEVIRRAGFPLQLEGIRIEDLMGVEEAFLTSASRAVLPVTEIDSRPVGDGRPGPITRQILQGYQDQLEVELDEV